MATWMGFWKLLQTFITDMWKIVYHGSCWKLIHVDTSDFQIRYNNSNCSFRQNQQNQQWFSEQHAITFWYKHGKPMYSRSHLSLVMCAVMFTVCLHICTYVIVLCDCNLYLICSELIIRARQIPWRGVLEAFIMLICWRYDLVDISRSEKGYKYGLTTMPECRCQTKRRKLTVK
jgi:hypothetical protein